MHAVVHDKYQAFSRLKEEQRDRDTFKEVEAIFAGEKDNYNSTALISHVTKYRVIRSSKKELKRNRRAFPVPIAQFSAVFTFWELTRLLLPTCRRNICSKGSSNVQSVSLGCRFEPNTAANYTSLLGCTMGSLRPRAKEGE